MDYDQKIQAATLRQRDAMGRTQFESPQGRMVSGIYVAPNPLEYLSAALRSAGAGREAQMAVQEIEQVGAQKKQAVADALRNFGTLAQGRAADVLPEDQAGPVRPAQAPNMTGAYQALLQAPDEAYQKAGFQGMLTLQQEEAKRAQENAQKQQYMSILQSSTPQQAIAAGVPVDIVKAFAEAPNLGRAKVEYKDVGGQLVPVTEYGDRPAGVGALDKTGNPFSDLVVRGPGGSIVPNAPLAEVKGRIAERGAANTNVSVNMPDKKFYEGLGTAVSGQIEQGFNQAQSAVQTLNNANQIRAGLKQAIVGPLANQRLTLAQLGQWMGVGGKDNKEVLENTRSVMQGLARQELAAAGQMKGQGQITETERAILRKAESGQINEMTKPEIEVFLGAITKTANSRIATHERNVKNLSTDPQAATILPYLQINTPESASNVDSLLEKYK